MELKFHHIIAFLSVAFVASHAALPSEEYWKSVLPHTQMPESVKHLLHSQGDLEWLDEKDDTTTDVGVSKGGIVDGSTNPGEDTSGSGGGTNVGVGKGGVGVDAGGGHTNVGVGKGGVMVGTRTRRGKPIYVGVKPGPDPFVYLYAASETQIHDDSNRALFFLEKDLNKGNSMNLHFPKRTDNMASFLPREVADSIPFSSNKFPEIFSTFSVKPGSYQAEAIEKTVKECEEKGINGEDKFCATSLESMIDFSLSKLGKNVEAISTSSDKAHDLDKSKEYAIMEVEKMTRAKKPLVVCHRQEYAYAVFYCHKTEKTIAYKVSTVAVNDGSTIEAVAVCHRDTAAWNPKHLAFQVLKVKPGTVPICHFLPEDHVVWVPKN